MGKNITWKRGMCKQYHLPYDIKAIGKNIKWGKGTENLGKKIKIKKWRGGRISNCWELYTPLSYCVGLKQTSSPELVTSYTRINGVKVNKGGTMKKREFKASDQLNIPVFFSVMVIGHF